MADNLLTTKLQQQLEELVALQSLLESELNVIASRNGDELRDITPKKRDALNKIQSLDREIRPLLENTAREETTEALIAEIENTLRTCKKQNDVNAQAAHQAHMSIKQIKDILIGEPTSVTYDQGGSVIASGDKLVRNLKA